jgi:hypothetical protein
MDDAARILQDKAAHASALASRYQSVSGMNDQAAMKAAYAAAGATLRGTAKPSELPQVACGGSYL